jgi:OOP family OmpA-OmpF porin
MRRGAFWMAMAAILGAAAGCARELPGSTDAPPAPLATKYVVFFDFKSATPSPDTLRVIAEAVQTAHQSNLNHVIVIGHADGIGTPADNKKLSERRAKAVKAVLISDGVQEENIAAFGSGPHDSLVQTGANVRDPLNRRAVIRLDN